MPRPRRETALYRVSALVSVSLLLGQNVLVRSQRVTGVDNCEELKSTIEDAGTSDEQLIVQVQEGSSQIVCREGIYVALGQSIRVEGLSDRHVPTEFFLDAEGIFESSGDGNSVGIMFENDGDLELYNLAFLLDYVLPEDETTTTSLDTADSTYGVRIVQNSGAVNVTDCRIAGSRSVANQAYVLGQAVNSAADSASVFVSGLTYDNLSPSGSVIRAIGVSEVTIEDSSFYSGSDFAPSTGFGSEGSIIFGTSDVELSVTGSTFQSRPESIAGGASISCVGGTVTDCRFIGQYASQVGGGAVYSVDSGSDRPLVIESSVFQGNIASTSASCIAVNDRNMTIRSSQFTGNEGTPVLFESSSSIGEHQLVVEDTEFADNYETTAGDLGSYNGGSAVVVRSTGTEEEETLTVTSGSFTNTVCRSNVPSTCEIVLDGSQVTLSGSSTCLVCDGDSTLGATTPSPLLYSPSPAPLLQPTPAPSFFYYGSTNPAGTLSPLYAGGTLNPTTYVTTTMMTMAPTASPTQAPTPVPAPVEDPVAACGAYIYTCEALKRAVEYERVNRTEACGFNLAINMTCSSSITIPSGMEIEINGLLPSEREEELNATTTTSAADDDVSATVRRRRLLPSGNVGGTNDSRSWLFAGNGCCGDEDDGATEASVDSLFVVESGGRLTLTDLGFQVATTSANMRNISVRAAYSSGELYVDGCDFVGPASTEVNERGGAIYSRGEILSIFSSSFCFFTAERSGGAVHVTDVMDGNGSVASVMIRSSSFAKNGALSPIPGSGGGAIAVMEGPVLEVTDCSFEDNYGRLGAAVLCSGGEFDGSVFVGGDSQTDDQGNGGLRSAVGALTINNCSFVNVTAGTYDSVAPGSALQVLDSNLTVTETTFEGCTGTPLYMETNYPNGNPYYLQVESTVFSSNTDPGTNGTSGSAAEFNAANGTEIDNGGADALDMICEGNAPSECEVVTASGATTLLFEIGVGCHVCDGQGVTAAGLENSTGEMTYTAESGEELKSLIDSGLSGIFRLVDDISTTETITVVDGQTVTIMSASSDGTPLYYSINPSAPFNGTNSAAAAAAASDDASLVTTNSDAVIAAAVVAAADDAYGSDSDSVFVVEPGASLTFSGLVLNATVLSSGVNSSDDDSSGLVRAVYNGGNVTVEDCTFVGTAEKGTNGGAIYNSLTATHLMVSDSFFYGLSVSSYGGAIYAAENTTVTLSETSFEQNEADSSGGSVFVEWGTKLEVQGGSFQESSAPEGAAIALCGGVLTGVTITSCNTTEETNGAVVSGESDGYDCPFDLNVSNAIFDNNSGGGLAGFDTNVYVTGCNFTGNTGTAAYFEASDGFTIGVEDVIFVNNTDATEWSTDASEEGGSDLVVLSSNGVAEGSTAILTDVTCTAPASSSSTCTVIVDEESFDLSTESVACGVCNLDGSGVNSTAADTATSSSGAWSSRRILAVVLPIVLALLLCCCCCLYYSRRGKQWKRKKGRRHYLFRYPSMDERWGPEETPRPPSSSSGGNSRPSSGARGGGDGEDVVAAAAGFGDEYERMMLARAEAEAEVPDEEDIPPLVASDGKMVVYTEGEDDAQDFDIDEDIKRQVEASRTHVAFAPPEKEQEELEVKQDEDVEAAAPGDSASASTTAIAAAAVVGAATAIAVATSSTTGGDANAAGGDATEAETRAAGARAAKEEGETLGTTVTVVTTTGAEQPYVEDVDDDEESLVYHSTSGSGGSSDHQKRQAADVSAEGGETKEVVVTTPAPATSAAAIAGAVPTTLATAVLSASSQGRKKGGSSATSSAVLSSSSSSVGVGAKTAPLPTPTHVCMSTIPHAYPPAEAAMSQSSSEGSSDAGGADEGRILPQAHSFLPMEGEVEGLEETHRTGEIHQ